MRTHYIEEKKNNKDNKKSHSENHQILAELSSVGLTWGLLSFLIKRRFWSVKLLSETSSYQAVKGNWKRYNLAGVGWGWGCQW